MMGENSNAMRRFDLSGLNSASTARTYPVEAEELHAIIEAVVEELPRWTLAHSSEEEIQAVRESRIFGFEDDVTARLTAQTFGVRVEFESASRVGTWDLGQNGRNLRELTRAIDRGLIGRSNKLGRP